MSAPSEEQAQAAQDFAYRHEMRVNEQRPSLAEWLAEREAALVRERCAKVADEHGAKTGVRHEDCATKIAAAIRGTP